MTPLVLCHEFEPTGVYLLVGKTAGSCWPVGSSRLRVLEVLNR